MSKIKETELLECEVSGIDLRDEIAMRALPAFIQILSTSGGEIIDAATKAYICADAMLFVREQKKG